MDTIKKRPEPTLVDLPTLILISVGSNVQGSTDHCLLFHILPGNLETPTATQKTYKQYLEEVTPSTNDPRSANWWGIYAKYSTSLLKAWYGDNATKDNTEVFLVPDCSFVEKEAIQHCPTT